MKAFLLCAGNGTRLRPITDSIPKCMVPIKGIPLLRIWLDLCSSHGIDDVLINLHSHADQVRAFLKAYDGDVSVAISEEQNLLGSAGTLAANVEWVLPEESFAILYGDVLTNVNLTQMAQFHRGHAYTATLGVHEVQNPRDCGIVETEADGVITGFIEKPDHPSSNLAFSGVLFARREMLKLLPAEVPADIGFHLLPKLIGRSVAYPIGEYLLDIGSMNTYDRAQQTWPS